MTQCGTVSAVAGRMTIWRKRMRLRADRRDERRREALLRNQAWQGLSATEKLVRLKQRPGQSKRQRTKLTVGEVK